jgi:hypothetical protein
MVSTTEQGMLTQAVAANHGTIVTAGASAHGVAGIGGLQLLNTGDIWVDGANANAVSMGLSALTGPDAGLKLTNEGSLRAAGTAIKGSETHDNIENSGEISGDIALLAGDDQLLLTDGSSFTGQAHGGIGSDTLTAKVSTQMGLNGDDFSAFETFTRLDGGILTLSGTLDVANAHLQGGNTQMIDAIVSGNMTVNAGAELSGNFSILGDLDVNGGTVSPGFSPGTGTILGDFLLDGILDIEIGGTGAGMFDQLLVGGDFIAGANAFFSFSFIDGFMPSTDDAFDFLSIAGTLIGAGNIGYGISGANGDFMLDFDGGDFLLTGGSSMPPPRVPEPSSLVLWLLGFGLMLVCGPVARNRIRLTARPAQRAVGASRRARRRGPGPRG